MKIRDYCFLGFSRIFGNKKEFAFGSLVVCFAVVIMGVSTTVALSMANASFVEMKEMSSIFSVYVSMENNAIYRMLSIVFALSVCFGVVLVAGYFLRLGTSDLGNYRNKLILGATRANIAVEAFLYNFIVFICGFVFGVLASYVICFLIGFALGEVIMYNFYIYLISAVVYLSAVILSSIIPAIWVGTDKA